MTISAKKIFFIEDSFEFNANDLNSNKIRGAEKILINLTNEVAKIDNLSVYVFNNTSIDKKINNVKWLNINKIQDHKDPDFLIAWSDANLLSNINSPNKYIWSHSVQPIEKFIRKKQLLAFIKNKPKVILEGDYHFKNRSFFTSLYGKHIIRLAPDYDFLSVEINANNIPSPNAIFTTRSDRNLEYLLDCWNEIIKLSKASKSCDSITTAKSIRLGDNIRSSWSSAFKSAGSLMPIKTLSPLSSIISALNRRA